MWNCFVNCKVLGKYLVCYLLTSLGRSLGRGKYIYIYVYISGILKFWYIYQNLMFQLIYTFSQHAEGFQVSIFSSQKNFTKLNRKLNIFRFPFQWLRTEAFITHFVPPWGFRLRTQTVKFICSDSWTDWVTVTAGATGRGKPTLSQEGKGNRYLRTLGSNYYRPRWLIEWEYFFSSSWKWLYPFPVRVSYLFGGQGNICLCQVTFLNS